MVYGWGRGVVSCMAARARRGVLSDAVRSVGVGIVAPSPSSIVGSSSSIVASSSSIVASSLSIVASSLSIVASSSSIVASPSSHRHRRVTRPPGPP